MTPLSKTGEPFFVKFHIVVLAIVLFGFGGNMLFRSENVMDVSTALVCHGLFMFAWYILMVVQTLLIAKGNHKLHMALGQASMAIVIGVIVSGIIITVISYQTSQDIGPVAVNLFIVINLILLYGLGLANRKNGAFHKRYMTYASIAMIVPALARVAFVLSVNPVIALPLLILLLIVPLVYDYRSNKKIHRASLVGSIAVFLGTAIGAALVSTPAFTTLVDKLLL